MATALAWESRWPNPPYFHHATTPQPSAYNSSDAMTSDPRNDAYPAVSSRPSMGEESRHPTRSSSHTDPYTDPSTYHSRLHERPSPPSGALTNAPPQPPAHHHARDVSSWPDPHQRHNSGKLGNEIHGASAAALTLQIPQDQELPRISTMFTTPPSGHYYPDNKTNVHTPSTMLPPFASFQDHAKRADGFNDLQRTPTLAHSPCQTCSKLQPMVAEVATAVADLDENIQLMCNKPWSRSSEYPRENLLHAVQWILERLRCGKVDMQAAVRAVHPSSGSQPTPTSGMASRNTSPSMPLKRSAELWDREDSPMHKRQNIGRPFEEPHRTQSLPGSDRTAAHPYFKGQMRPSHITPPPTDSTAGAAYPKIPSPGHAMRSLPSPSSVAYPSSAAPSSAPQNAHSPTMSNTADASLHPGSADAATSAHIADLQHQVTLKSLALQTLRSEYSSLLQRVQRLNVKTQTMERKSSVADREVNELTNKNEDLTQQCQSLQEQLDDSERRREKEREESSREKDQWLQMLDQGRRLQARVTQETKALTERIAALQAENDQVRSERVPELPATDGELAEVQKQSTASSSTSALATSARFDDVASLKAEIEMLRSSLEAARNLRQLLDDRAHQVLRQSTDIGNVIDRALGKQSSDVSHPSSPSPGTPPQFPRDNGTETLNLGSFRPLTTYDASIRSSESPTTPSLSITVTESPTKSEALATAAASLPTPVTPLSAADQQSNYGLKPSTLENATEPTTTMMPPPPRPVA